MKTDTPRTDAIQFQPLPISMSIENEMHRALSRQLERELAASQAEVKELKQQKINCLEIIDDDAKERSELKAEVEFWKAKAHEAEDREGKHEAEVERLRESLKYAVWVLKSYNPKYAEEIEATLTPPTEPTNERAEKAEAEVERLLNAISKLADEIECTSKCSSHQAGYCDCGRLERAYAISDSIPQNPTTFSK